MWRTGWVVTGGGGAHAERLAFKQRLEGDEGTARGHLEERLQAEGTVMSGGNHIGNLHPTN